MTLSRDADDTLLLAGALMDSGEAAAALGHLRPLMRPAPVRSGRCAAAAAARVSTRPTGVAGAHRAPSHPASSSLQCSAWCRGRAWAVRALVTVYCVCGGRGAGQEATGARDEATALLEEALPGDERALAELAAAHQRPPAEGVNVRLRPR